MEIQTNGGLIAVSDRDPLYSNKKVLVIKFEKELILANFIPPNLKYILFSKKDNLLIVSLKYEPLREFFNYFIEVFCKMTKVSDTDEKIIDNLRLAINSFKKLIETEKILSLEKSMGLYGEMLFIKTRLHEETDHLALISGWHRPVNSNHDFDFENFSCEVKTVSRLKTNVDISSEFQLETYNDKKLLLILFRIEHSNNDSFDSLGDIYREILLLLNNQLAKELFISKCENSEIEYIGPDYIELPYKFQLIEKFSYQVDQINFPRIKRNILLPSISKVRYSIDISSIESFKIEF